MTIGALALAAPRLKTWLSVGKLGHASPTEIHRFNATMSREL